MKGRKIAVLLFLALLLSLTACGNEKEKNVRTSDKPTASENQTDIGQEMDESDEFSKGVIRRSIHNFEYLVPQAWQAKDGDDGRTSYYYPEDIGSAPMMMVHFEEFGHDYSIENEDDLSKILDGFLSGIEESNSSENFSLSMQNVQSTISDIPFGYAEYSSTINGIDLTFKLAIFCCQNGIVNFSMGMPSDGTIDYTKDFYRVLNSVEVLDDPTQGAVGEYYVSIGDCSFTTDYDGNKVIIINYDFTNNSNKTVAPIWEIRGQAFQDGVQLETAIVLKNSVYDPGIEQKNIRPGITLTGCQVAYVMTSDSPVEFEMGTLFGNPVLTKTFNVR